MFATKVLLETMKKTTGLVGIPVVKNAKEVLIGLYNQTLKEIQVCSLVPLVRSKFPPFIPLLFCRLFLKLPNTERTLNL